MQSLHFVFNNFIWIWSCKCVTLLISCLFHSKKKKLVGEANCSSEMFLYHGTASHLVEPICAQSFDPRLHGTHETLYGKGSYFAKNASYSHGYSLPDQDGYFYMFLAQVLVGQYVKVRF